MKYDLFVRKETNDYHGSYNPCYLTIFVYSESGDKFAMEWDTGRLIQSFEMEAIPEECTMEIPKMLYAAIVSEKQN